MKITNNKIINKIIQISGLSKIFTTSIEKKRAYKNIKNERKIKKIFRWRHYYRFYCLNKDFGQHA